MIKLNPLTVKQLKRFRSIKRGYYSFIIFFVLVFLSLFAELLVNSRALMVYYEGQIFLPTFADFYPGTTFGETYQYETNYRNLQRKFEDSASSNFVIMPLVPYNALENDLQENRYPPFPPSLKDGHYLGTDKVGRDILARLIYGFRIAIFFSLLLLVSTYAIGVSVGCAMGYFGGKLDLFGQRIIEIWTNVPFLYVVMIISSIMIPNFWTLATIMIVFGWHGMTWYLRTSTYKEKAREYALAAKALGATDKRVIFVHILPNTISIIVTFIPFSISSGIVALTSLDYLGFGLPPPTPSWGELLAQGMEKLDCQWIISSVVSALIAILTMVTFVGEAIREAFDPKKFTVYE
jgi:microcin C transport system permease protein